jgi:zinc protease
VKKSLLQVAAPLMSVLLVLSPALTRGQAPASAQPQPTRFNRAPVSDEILHVHIPRPVKQTLPNGVRVLVLENHRAAAINVSIYVEGAGGLFDPAGQPGLANMTGQLLSKGTLKLSAQDIARTTDTQGAKLSVTTSSTTATTSVSASGLSFNFDRWFPIVADVLLHPIFPADELADAKQRQLSHLQSQEVNASFLATKHLRRTLYGDTPEGIVSATPASTTAFSRDVIRDFYTQRYAPQNTILIIAGDITPAKAFAAVSDALKDWQRTGLQVKLPPVTPETAARMVTLVDRPGSVQTNLVLGRLAIDRRDPDYVPLMVTNHILGTGPAGRLFMRLREEKSYTYGAYSTVEAGDYRGYVSATSEVRSSVTGGALDEFFNEFHRLGSESVGSEELKRHEHSMVAIFALSLETPAAAMNYVYTQEHYGFPEDYWDRYAEQLATISAADVMRMGAKYFSGDQMQVVAVGDPSIRPALAKWGDVQEVKP